MPPEHPSSKESGAYLYKFLRPEFLRRQGQALSSDAFSAFGKDNASVHNGEVIEATKLLRERIVPQFAKDLDSMPAEKLSRLGLTDALHRQGLNLRYMGLLRHHLAKPSTLARGLLLMEMVRQTIKSNQINQ